VNFSGSSFACEAFRVPNRVRVEAEFASRFNVIWVAQSSAQKNFACAVGQITFTHCRVLFPQRGALRDRHERWKQDAMDALAAR
jgi:hypothetical protein